MPGLITNISQKSTWTGSPLKGYSDTFILQTITIMQNSITNSKNQLSIAFDTLDADLAIIEAETKANTPRLVAGGIYMYKEDTLDEIYDGMFGVCWGRDAFCFLMDGMDHIENEVEIASAHNMKLVEGYGLAYHKIKKEWYIRNSSRKHQPDYILASGKYNEGFEQSLKKYAAIFHK